MTGANRPRIAPVQRHPDPKLASVDGAVARRRYELFDGTLIVRPAPQLEHQRAVARLLLTLQRNCPRSLEVLPGPIGFQPTNWLSFAPDLVVVSRSRSQKIGPQTTAPVLIAEVADRSSRAFDRNVKPNVYAACGVDYYWLFDPAVPEFIAYHRRESRYVETVTATGTQRVGLHKPILVEICPARLTAG